MPEHLSRPRIRLIRRPTAWATVLVVAIGGGGLLWQLQTQAPDPRPLRPTSDASADPYEPAPVDLGRDGLPVGSIVIGPSVGVVTASSERTDIGISGGGASATAVTVPAGLYPGDMAFWDGSYVLDGTVSNAALCDVTGPCFEYPLVIQADGARLRVAIDTPSREDTFALELVDPAGDVVATTGNRGQFNAEMFLADPPAGGYVVRVRPQGVERASFRMRAKLEDVVPGAPAGRVALLPNLRVVPPYEFGFTAPIAPNGSYPPDAANPPASAAGRSLYSCTQDETAPVDVGGAGAVDCLRLTSGPINLGPGPFDMRFTFISDMADGTADRAYLRGPIFQSVHYSDGTEELRPAGTYIWHTTHSHFHDENILTYEGFTVTDETAGGLDQFGSGTKSGFCPADQLFGQWFEFNQAVRGDFGEGDTPTGNCFDPKDGLLGLTSGWGDVYRWQRPGQYVEFSGRGDGLYVIRSTVDKANHILETDETDNVSYALIRVVDRAVQVIERGQGTDPWDADKLVFTGDGPASYR